MEDWFIFSLLSALFAGLYSFFLKISAEKKHNSSLVTAYSMFTASLIGLVFFLFNITNIDLFLLLLLLAFGNAVFYFIAIITRIESLKNITTTIYFPIYKTVGPILMLFLGILIFSESLNQSEFFGILMGLLIPLLLIHKKEKKRQINLKKGLIYLGIGTIFSVTSSSLSKILIINNMNIFLYIFISFLIGGSISLYFSKTVLNKNKKTSFENIIEIGILNGIFLFSSMYFFAKALIGNLAVVYTINSFSILIPIVLSIFVYKEHFDIKKGIAIGLCIVSLFFFK